MNYRVWVGNKRTTFIMYDSVRDVMRKLRRDARFVESEISIFEDSREGTLVAVKECGNKNFSWRRCKY